MNKTTMISIIAIIALIGGAGIFVTINKESPLADNTATKQSITTDTQSADQPMPATDEANQTTGSYVMYSEENLKQYSSTTRLLFFHAPWCPQCREFDASITASSLPANTTILKVDYDTNQKLRQKYGVTIQTTVVKIDADGGRVESYVAYDEPTFASVESALLP